MVKRVLRKNIQFIAQYCYVFFVLIFTSESIDNPYLNITMDSHKSQVQGSFESIIERVEIVEYSMYWNSSFY